MVTYDKEDKRVLNDLALAPHATSVESEPIGSPVLGQRPVGDRVRVWVKPAVLIRERPAGCETKSPMQYTSVSSQSLLLGSQRHYPRSARG